MNVKDSVLYRTLQRQVRKQDHAELLRMLELVPEWWDRHTPELSRAFNWSNTTQRYDYWYALYHAMRDAGHPHY